MFSNGHKSDVGQPFQCYRCNCIFERVADDDDEICNKCLDGEDD